MMGPYTSNNINMANRINILYKPAACIPHLVSLLYSMIKDNSYNTSYSLHITKAIDYINERYSQPITLSNISHYLNINRCYFCSMFKKETGKSFSHFLNEVRIEKSKSLLLKETLSILEVSLSVGFNNQNYYNTVFKKITNMTPLEYRSKIS